MSKQPSQHLRHFGQRLADVRRQLGISVSLLAAETHSSIRLYNGV